MVRKLLLMLTMLTFFNCYAFAQFEVMTAEQAKQELSELKLTSMEIDKIISDYLIPFSSELLQNGVMLKYMFSGDCMFRLDDIVGVRVYVAAEGGGAPCVDYRDSTISIKKLEPGYYTITQKLLFTEQIKRKKRELFDTFRSPYATKLSSRESRETEIPDSVIMKSWFDEICKYSVSKEEFQSTLLKKDGLISTTRYIVVLSDKDGRDYFVPNISASVFIRRNDDGSYSPGRGKEEYYCGPTSMEGLKIYASSYLEKIERILKGKECYLKMDARKYYDDPISKDTKPIPDRNALYKCERLIMLDGKLFGVFSNDSGNYSVQIGRIVSYLVDENGNKVEEYLNKGGYYFRKDGELYCSRGARLEKSDAYFACDGYIEGDVMSIVPESFLEEKKKLEKDIMASRAESRAKWEMESEREKKIAEKAIIDKYGAAMGGNINNHKIVLGMTTEMCQKSWGYPLERNSTTNLAGTAEVWIYYSAMLTFVDGRLIQIDKW